MPEASYHAGERSVQQRTGEAAIAERNGRAISPRVPAAARGFVAQQDLVVLGSVDPRSRVWATLVTGRAGFAAVSDDLGEVHLTIDDPDRVLDLAPSLGAPGPDAPIAMLFIDLATRRRLRVNGRLSAVAAGSLGVRVEQAYPACPKYIQRRRSSDRSASAPDSASAASADRDALVALIETADTLFIASAGPDGLLDVSHKGGRRGFAEWRDGAIHIPDFAGNSMFNTLGNLELDDRAGLCIPDFERSCQWSLTGRARGRFDVEGSDERTGGTRRCIEFVPTDWACRPLNVARDWTFVDSSPFNP